MKLRKCPITIFKNKPRDINFGPPCWLIYPPPFRLRLEIYSDFLHRSKYFGPNMRANIAAAACPTGDTSPENGDGGGFGQLSGVECRGAVR